MSTIAPPRRFVVASSDERAALAELEAAFVEPAPAESSVVAPDGRQIALPASAARLLREIVHDLAQGLVVELAALGPELTTQQAAAALQVPEACPSGLIPLANSEMVMRGAPRDVGMSEDTCIRVPIGCRAKGWSDVVASPPPDRGPAGDRARGSRRLPQGEHVHEDARRVG
jgi:hypothetical protein